ncbi:MAG: IPT/TIG domain-containing protein [Chloroflexi bacterium]|nr:IPT/TIG domain-containing protein [Chloroflexota bacterium]
MKRDKSLRILGIALAFALMAVTIPALPALAATLTLSPTSGPPGTTVTVTGDGFTPGNTIGIDFRGRTMVYVTGSPIGRISTSFVVPADAPGGNQPVVAVDWNSFTQEAATTFIVIRASATITPDEGPVGTQVKIDGQDFSSRENITVEYDGVKVDIQSGDVKTDSSGDFDDTAIIVPPSAAGSHTITVIGETSATEVEVDFTVVPQASISLTSGLPGTQVTATGTGFGSRSQVTIRFSTTQVATVQTDRDGSFTATFSVPALPPGKYTVESKDALNNRDSAEFTISATIAVTPTRGTVGTGLTVTGRGFSGAVVVKYDGIGVVTATADSGGSFSATFNAPPSASGTHTIAAGDASATFTVLSSFSASPVTGSIGTEIAITGTGFRASQAMRVTFGNIQVKTVTADATGSFSSSFPIPPLPAGSYQLVVTDGVNTGSADITITVDAALSQATGNIGSKLTVSGVGFTGAITIKYDDTGVATTTADAKGGFSTTFTVPPSVAGKHTVTISDNTNTVKTTFTMESEPPPAPAPLLPEMGAKAKARAYFDWEDVTDPSGVTYTLQVATSKDFAVSSIVLEKPGLTSSKYTLAEAEKLESTKKDSPYYWRVKAIDGASSESMSSAGAFYVGFTLSLPGWAMYTLIGVGGLLIFLLGLWVGRQTSYT